MQEGHNLGAGADTVGLKAEVCAVSYAVLDRPCDRLCVPCAVLHVGKAGGLGGFLVACRVPQDHDDLRTGDAVVGIVVAGTVALDDALIGRPEDLVVKRIAFLYVLERIDNRCYIVGIGRAADGALAV